MALGGCDVAGEIFSIYKQHIYYARKQKRGGKKMKCNLGVIIIFFSVYLAVANYSCVSLFEIQKIKSSLLSNWEKLVLLN